ncbi:MAG: nuclear pore complex subunit [Flavobacteriales bacterium]|nr:MAG: nuclear pore complex subunit [Flavobacteriales bacterium]
MEKIRIEPTDVSPEVIFDIEKNLFSIKGKSVVTEVDSFYIPLIEWLENAQEQLDKRIDFVFDLEYFNIFSSKRILFILYKLRDLKEEGVDVHVIWHFSIEDDDMKEVGEDFACMVNLPFEFISNTMHPELI